MRIRLQFGECLLVLGMAALAVPCAEAQRGRANFAQQRPPRAAQPHPQAHPPAQHPQAQRPPAHPPAQPPRQNESKPPQNNRPQGMQPPQGGRNPNRPPSAQQPNPQERIKNMTPEEKNRLAQTKKKFDQLPPQKQQELRDAARNWQKLTPEQQSHLKNDVIPKWKQLPAPRQKAIQQRLGVLQNMPESARDQHLNDPNFTRGMSDEDKAMLKDLSHMHVAGAPEPPGE